MTTHRARRIDARMKSILFPLVVVVILATAGALPEASSAATVRCNPSIVWVPNAHPRCEQIRYVRETIAMTHEAFIARKQDFTTNGCNRDLAQAEGCRKPYPYNQFDWTADGCSFTPPDWAAIFAAPCELHDFGYRNFGRGLTLQRTERARAVVDRAFRREMYRICRTWGDLWQRVACKTTARGMYNVVRNWPPNVWEWA